MKISHIIALVIIAVGIAVMLTTLSDASQYVTFKQADELAAEGDNDEVHVVGKLKRDSRGDITGMFYDPKIDANRFEFTLVDSTGIEKPVIFYGAKPQGMEESEQVVIVGHSEKTAFVAKQILTKCPSKYKDETPSVN